MKKIGILTPGQALALALSDAAQSCRILRNTLVTAQEASRSKRSRGRVQRLSKTLAELDRHIKEASELAQGLAPTVKVKEDPEKRRRNDKAAAAAIDREVAAFQSLAEEASGNTPSAALSARVLADREGDVHRRINRLAARRSSRVRDRARKANGRVEMMVHESAERQEEVARHDQQSGRQVSV